MSSSSSLLLSQSSSSSSSSSSLMSTSTRTAGTRLAGVLRHFASCPPASTSSSSLSSSSSSSSSSLLSRNFTSSASPKERVAVIGSGNWGSVAAKIVGENTARLDAFETDVNVWVYEEDYHGEKLTDVINRQNENVRYLPGTKLGANVHAVPDLLATVDAATMLVFVTPHQFIGKLCEQMRQAGVLAPNARAISLIKGMDVTEDGFELISGLITNELGIDCSVLMGANIANEVAAEKFSEATVGYHAADSAALWQQLFNRPYFDVRTVNDVVGVELCGTLKNIVALAAGFSDGLDLGNNAKAAFIRIGLNEMKGLATELFPTVLDETFFHSCGVADLITTCFGGRNRMCAEAFVLADGDKSFEQLEAELLNGQKLQGVLTSHEVQAVLQRHGLEQKFPLFTTINRICSGQIPPQRLVEYKSLPQ